MCHCSKIQKESKGVLCACSSHLIWVTTSFGNPCHKWELRECWVWSHHSANKSVLLQDARQLAACQHLILATSQARERERMQELTKPRGSGQASFLQKPPCTVWVLKAEASSPIGHNLFHWGGHINHPSLQRATNSTFLLECLIFSNSFSQYKYITS